MLKIVAPALAVVAALYFISHRGKKDAPNADEDDRLADMAAGAYPGE